MPAENGGSDDARFRPVRPFMSLTTCSASPTARSSPSPKRSENIYVSIPMQSPRPAILAGMRGEADLADLRPDERAAGRCPSAERSFKCGLNLATKAIRHAAAACESSRGQLVVAAFSRRGLYGGAGEPVWSRERRSPETRSGTPDVAGRTEMHTTFRKSLGRESTVSKKQRIAAAAADGGASRSGHPNQAK